MDIVLAFLILLCSNSSVKEKKFDPVYCSVDVKCDISTEDDGNIIGVRCRKAKP